jgi:hypothetical protein
VDKLGTIAEVFRMVWHRRAWVLLPPIVMLTLVGALVLFGQASPLAPLLYPLF